MPLSNVKASTDTGQVTVNAANLYLRAGNSFDSKPIRVLHKGEAYKVFAQSNGLYNLGGNQWVTASEKYVHYSSTPDQDVSAQNTSKYVTVNVGNLNIRSDADFSSKILGIATYGQSFLVLDERNGLYQISPGKWISASTKYVKTSDQSPSNSTDSPISSIPTPSSNIQQIINLGKSFMGTPYVWGSSNPNNGGFDCSGFIYYVFKNSGYNISRLNVEGYWNTVQHLSNPEVGDLVFFQNTYRVGPSHIGIYLGNGKFLDANGDKGISIDDLSAPYWRSKFLGYGRIN
jgi:N-acetylmuramoyl-L-alanine amidase